MDQKIQELARELKRQYQREWKRNNPEKVKDITRRYWERKAEKLLEEHCNTEHSNRVLGGEPDEG